MKNCALLFLLVTQFLVAQTAVSKIDYGNNKELGTYFSVNGIELYYEIYGTGKPLVLLHGNGGSIGKHAARIEHFKSKYQVIAIDARAHGKSGDATVPLSFELMTEDISKLLEHLNVGPAHFWGQSDGGVISVFMAKNYPHLVDKVAAFGVNTNVNGIHQKLREQLIAVIPQLPNDKTKKHYTLLRDYPTLKSYELKSIQAPVLLMFGDRDVVNYKHIVELFEVIPNSNLFVMPGATHFGAYEKSALFYTVLDAFYEDPFSSKSSLEIFLGPNYKDNINYLQFAENSIDPSLCEFTFQNPEETLEYQKLDIEYKWHDLVKDQTTDIDKAFTLLDWTHKRWQHNGNNEPKKNDAYSILKEAENGKNFRCVEYSIVLSASLSAIGIPTRTVGLKTKDVETRTYGAGHVASEAYFPTLKKWVFLDGQMNYIPFLDGIPLNAVEYQEAIFNAKEQLELRNIDGTLPVEEAGKLIAWIIDYLFYFDVAFDDEQGTCKGKKRLMLVPLHEKPPTVFQVKNKIENCLYTHNVLDFYSAPVVKK